MSILSPSPDIENMALLALNDERNGWVISVLPSHLTSVPLHISDEMILHCDPCTGNSIIGGQGARI